MTTWNTISCSARQIKIHLLGTFENGIRKCRFFSFGISSMWYINDVKSNVDFSRFPIIVFVYRPSLFFPPAVYLMNIPA